MRNILLAVIAILTTTSVKAYDLKESAIKTAIFAGGCFWCVEADFEKSYGVIKVESGYTGGDKADPTYDDVSKGNSKHVEAVQVTYDAHKTTYIDLLKLFYLSVDPTVENKQFCDEGPQYRTVIFYGDESEKAEAEEITKRAEVFLKTKVYTEITKAGKFYLAEEEHQDYYKKNKIRYNIYRTSCGRDKRLDEIWGKNRKLQKIL